MSEPPAMFAHDNEINILKDSYGQVDVTRDCKPILKLEDHVVRQVPVPVPPPPPIVLPPPAVYTLPELDEEDDDDNGDNYQTNMARINGASPR